jgi:putative hemolysin
LTEVVIILALIAANGVFAGAEIAVVASRKTRIQELAEEGRSSARAVLGLRENPERFLATVQVGITVVSATAAAFGGVAIAERLAPVLAQIPALTEHAEGVALGLVVAVISYLSIVLGELVPKSLALRSAEQYALLIAKPLLALSWLARPIVWLLSSSANLLLKPLGDQTTFTETRHSAEELQQLVEEATKAGTIKPEAGEIVSRALELDELTAGEVMVPRQQVVSIAKDATADELTKVLLEQGYSRMPVYEERIDNIVGYVSVKDFLAQALKQQSLAVHEVMRAPFFVPESKGAVELLEEMRRKRLPFAIVLDEQGGTSGIVTIEDLVEELVGDIFSEHARPQGPLALKVEKDGSVLVNGMTPIRDVNRELDLGLSEDGAWTTIGGLCLELAGRVPSTGDLLDTPTGVKLEVVEASPRRVRVVRIRRPPTS